MTMTAPGALHCIRLADRAEQPWRNGGGTTRELLAWPAADDWTLRLSVARIERDGPFSAFPGVERHFVVLQGAGVRLAWPGAQWVLKRHDPPLRFDGAGAPHCALLDGATLDLNLMVTQAHGRGRLRPAPRGEAWTDAADWRGVYAEGGARLRRAFVGGVAATAAIDTAALHWSAAAAGETWTIEGIGAAWWIAFDPHDDRGEPR